MSLSPGIPTTTAFERVIGAAQAPDVIRKHFINDSSPWLKREPSLYDIGNLALSPNLPSATVAAEKSASTELDRKWLGLGGGHDTAMSMARVCGRFPSKHKPLIINFDAHLTCATPLGAQRGRRLPLTTEFRRQLRFSSDWHTSTVQQSPL